MIVNSLGIEMLNQGLYLEILIFSMPFKKMGVVNHATPIPE